MASKFFTPFKERKVSAGPIPKEKTGADASGSVKDKPGPYGSPFPRNRKGRYA